MLGTWGGAKGEEWNADTSTIIQVLVNCTVLYCTALYCTVLYRCWCPSRA